MEDWARCMGLIPVIFTTREAKIRRITIQSQSRQIVHETLSGKNTQHKTVLVEWLKWQITYLPSMRT
jgi:hypothetical protein